MAEGEHSYEMAYCLRVTERLIDHELAFPFLSPMKVSEEDRARYEETIKRPMDLGTVRDKLKKGEYKNPGEWVTDINLIWRNAMTFYPASAFEHAAAQAMHLKSAKYTRSISKNDLDMWCVKVKRAILKMDKTLAGIPQVDNKQSGKHVSAPSMGDAKSAGRVLKLNAKK